MFSRHIFGVAVGLLPLSHAFNLWPLVDAEGLSNVLQIPTDCLAALNATVACDQDLFQRTVNVDGLWWTQEDVSALCTSSCQSSAQGWKDNVDQVCAGEYMIQGDRMVEVETLATRFVEGLGLSCLRSSSGQWCFVEQQEWTGSDMVLPDCAANPSDPLCASPANATAANRRMASLYEDELLCSECFLHLMYKRVTSDFLADEDHSDYLVREFQDIQDVCQTTVGELATRVPPQYPTATNGIGWEPTEPGSPTTGEPTATATTTAVPNPDPNCDKGQWVDVFATSESSVAETDLESCNELAEMYGIATGDLLVTTGSPSCTIEPEGPLYEGETDEGWYCGSLPCQLLRVNEGDTCESIAEAISNKTNAISAVRLATWNPNVLGACDFLVPDQYICITRRGGPWVGPPESEIPEDGDGPVRGGPGSTPSLPILEGPSSPPAQVQKGIAPGCNRYVQANNTAASCWKIANDGGISSTRLFELNPVLGASGEYCDTQVWLGYYYCVRTGGEGPTTTSAPSSVPTAVPTPSPVHDGSAANCNRWAEAQAGDYCWKMADDAGIALADLYAWNAVLAGGDACDMIWPGYFYCVGVSSGSPPTTTQVPPPTTTTQAPAKPTQTQAGIPPNCAKFAQAKSGASCWQLANDSGISLDQFFGWNPVVGSQGENCGTQIWPDYYYCVGVSG